MANNLESNITRKVMRAFIPAFEKQRILSKTINTQTFQGAWQPHSGDYIDIKRPPQYTAYRTDGGDVSGGGYESDIIIGKATAQVQQYITVLLEWTNKEEALELDQLETILKPAAEQCTIELETSLCDYMIKNSGLATGSPGTAIDAWSDIASQMSMLKSIGAPMGRIYSIMNPFTIQNLASAQTGLSADPSRLVQTAWEQAQISTPFAGLRAISSNSLSSWTSSAETDRTGALSAAPDQTYATHKDTMIQTWALKDFTGAASLKAGDILEVTGKYYAHPRTHKTIIGADGNPIPFRATVAADATLTAGAGNVTVTGPALYESGGAYNNINAALATDDVIDILGSASAEYQPNLFYHKEAFAISFVKLPKLHTWDTVATLSDGISIRCTKYSDGDANKQRMRFDLLPAFGTMQPFWAGKGFGYA